MNWLKNRFTQGNTYEGVALVVAGVVMLMAPLNLIAYGMVAYGAIKIIKD
jgi:membrane-bound ClpP family serine protease